MEGGWWRAESSGSIERRVQALWIRISFEVYVYTLFVGIRTCEWWCRHYLSSSKSYQRHEAVDDTSSPPRPEQPTP